MTRAIMVIVAAAGLFGLAAADAARGESAPGTRTKRAAIETSGQSQPRVRPRARIRVAPAYPYRTVSTPYPVPYKYEFPGPGYVRQCTSWLAPENRVSGPVIVPRMRCWWEPGRSDLASWPD